MRIHFKTFGCKVNQCETAEMQSDVLKAGCFLSEPANADVVIINSCTVTTNADRKAKQYLRKCQRLKPEAAIFLTGCLVDRTENELKKDFSDVKFFKNSQKQNIVTILGFNLPSSPPDSRRAGISHLPSAFSNHTRAFVKIQDGCNGKCSYCIVPKVRSKMSSKDMKKVIVEVNGYVSAGHKEIVLCGIRLGRYRYEMPARRSSGGGDGRCLPDDCQAGELTNLIKELEKIKGLCRIRLSSIELNDITVGLVGLMSKSKKLCHHLHIPLQSGDDRILKDMKRPYTSGIFFEKIKKIRKKIPDIGVTTDIIIGYPLDTEESLSNTYSFVKKCRFSRLHVFKFSERPKTKAAMEDKRCPYVLTNKWSEKMRKLDLLLRRKFIAKFSGKEIEVLTEENGYGYTSNYIHVKLPQSVPTNELFSINI